MIIYLVIFAALSLIHIIRICSLENLAKHSGQLNKLDIDLYEKLLNRLFESYADKSVSDSFNIFSDTSHFYGDNLNEWKSLVGVDDESSLTSMLDSLFELLSSISTFIVKPKILARALTECKLSEERTKMFVELWKSNAGRIVDILKTKFKLPCQQLEDANWKVKLLADQSCDSFPKLPLAEMNLQLTDTKLSLNFTHEELSRFYNDLESIQNKIDQLQR